MRIATILHDGTERVAVVVEDQSVLLPIGTKIVDVLAVGEAERSALLLTATHSVPLSSVSLLPPLRPTTLRDFMTFEQHLAGAIRWVNPGAEIAPVWYEAPCFYFTNPLAVVADGEPVEFPPGCETLDFELELAVVLKKGGRNLSVADAADCIGGYTILNDWSARDIQSREMKIGLGPVKGKDFASTLGPWIVTADELAPYVRDDRLDVQMSVSINEVVVGQDTAAHMAWSFAEMIAYASRGAVVEAGDVLGSGTCGGGCLAELWGWAGQQDPAPLRPGDVVTLEIEGIGRISNTLVVSVPAPPVPSARRFAEGVRLA
jgi:2-keto-4-pentenoate hydratase/2-oxohepta-3-ene-1,7-dioic acid hydratase in catechol pathway